MRVISVNLDLRKMRVFQRDAYIAVDFAEKSTEILTLSDASGGNDSLIIDVRLPDGIHKKAIRFRKPEIEPVNSIKLELELFAKAIINDEAPPVTITDGYKALQVAHIILHKIKKNAALH